jgi:hypothetical protein
MHIVDRTELFAKPEVERGIAAMRIILRAALPDATFGEREAAALAISDEVVRGLLEGDLQAIADGLGQEVLVDGTPSLHEPGTDTYRALCGGLFIRRASIARLACATGRPWCR